MSGHQRARLHAVAAQAHGRREEGQLGQVALHVRALDHARLPAERAQARRRKLRRRVRHRQRRRPLARLQHQVIAPYQKKNDRVHQSLPA